MDKSLLEYWAKQFPVALTIGWIGWIAIRALVKYLVEKDTAREVFFIGELTKKDKIIEGKDVEIRDLNKVLTNLTVKNNEVLDNLKRLLEKAIKDR